MQRASLDANAVPAYTEGAGGVELIGVAEKAAAAEPEALESRAKSGRGRGLQTLLPREGELEMLSSREDLGAPGTLPRVAPTEDERGHETTDTPSEFYLLPRVFVEIAKHLGIEPEREGVVAWGLTRRRVHAAPW